MYPSLRSTIENSLKLCFLKDYQVYIPKHQRKVGGPELVFLVGACYWCHPLPVSRKNACSLQDPLESFGWAKLDQKLPKIEGDMCLCQNKRFKWMTGLDCAY